MKILKKILRAKATRVVLLVIAGLAIVALVLWTTLEVPRMVVEHDTPTVGKATADSIASIRQAILWIAGGLIAFVTLILSWSRYFLERRNTELAADTNFTNRYTEAIGQLGADSHSIVLGGIYALERIAFDSPRDRVAIAQVLASALRSNFPNTRRKNEGSSEIVFADRRSDEVRLAAIRVLSRVTQMENVAIKLDLSDTDLRSADLSNAQLRGANLSRSDLEGADISGAVLDNADLSSTRFEVAKWSGLSAVDTDFDSATLSPALTSYIYST